MAIARVITDAITDDGYLKDDLEDIRLSLLPEIEATPPTWSACWRVQSLEPAGVGARNPRRVHRLQLRQLHPDTPARDIAIRVALEHLDLVASPTAGAAAPPAALQRRRPGNGAGAGALLPSAPRRRGQPAQAEYVIPDVFVRRTDHGWIVEINQATVPRVRVNKATRI
jgi:RNA polymerase sigma-54 factor